MDIYYRKRENDATPAMCTILSTKNMKLFLKRKTPPKITCMFYDLYDNEIPPYVLMERRYRIIATVKVKYMYIPKTTRVSPILQLEVSEVIVTEMPKRRLLPCGRDLPSSSVSENEH